MLLLVTEGKLDVTLADVLFFTTGVKSVPPVGFKVTPSIEFMHQRHREQSTSLFPLAHTCSCTGTLVLPIVHITYEDFVSNFVYGVKNAHGFGYA